MATEREHIERAEKLAEMADAALKADHPHRAEVLAQMAAARAQLACARALTAEPPGSPRPSRIRDLPVTRIGDLP